MWSRDHDSGVSGVFHINLRTPPDKDYRISMAFVRKGLWHPVVMACEITK